MGDGDAADAADLGGPDFAPAIPTVESSVVGAPPTNQAIVLGPGYSGHVVLLRAPQHVQALPVAASSGPGGGARPLPWPVRRGEDSPVAHHDHA